MFLSMIFMIVLFSTSYGMISEESEIGEYGCDCDYLVTTLEDTNCYDINNDENTDVLDVVHLIDEIIN